MRTITLTVRQRIALEPIIAMQRSEVGNRQGKEELLTTTSLYDKLAIPEDEKPLYYRELGPRGEVELFLKTINAAVPAEFELEESEFRRLQSIMKELRICPIDHKTWYGALEQEMERAESAKPMPTRKIKKVQENEDAA